MNMVAGPRPDRGRKKETRTEHAEVSLLITNQKMLLAYADNTLAGVVKIEKTAPGVGGVNLLATDPDGLEKTLAEPQWPKQKPEAG